MIDIDVNCNIAVLQFIPFERYFISDYYSFISVYENETDVCPDLFIIYVTLCN